MVWYILGGIDFVGFGIWVWWIYNMHPPVTLWGFLRNSVGIVYDYAVIWMSYCGNKVKRRLRGSFESLLIMGMRNTMAEKYLNAHYEDACHIIALRTTYVEALERVSLVQAEIDTSMLSNETIEQKLARIDWFKELGDYTIQVENDLDAGLQAVRSFVVCEGIEYQGNTGGGIPIACLQSVFNDVPVIEYIPSGNQQVYAHYEVFSLFVDVPKELVYDENFSRSRWSAVTTFKQYYNTLVRQNDTLAHLSQQMEEVYFHDHNLYVKEADIDATVKILHNKLTPSFPL